MFVFQVFLGPNGEVEEYAVISIQANAAISSDLLLDQSEEHLFIMTSTMVQYTSLVLDLFVGAILPTPLLIGSLSHMNPTSDTNSTLPTQQL